MSRTKTLVTVALSALIALARGLDEAGAGEQRTVKATSAWVGHGQIVPTGSNWLYFVGAFRGVIFVESAEGELHTGRILCPGTLEIDITSGAQRGEGRCVITRSETDQVFARWSCAGTHGIECRGVFELTSGTGRFAGIQGKSDFRVRTGMADVTAGQSELIEVGVGLAEWPALSYTIP